MPLIHSASQKALKENMRTLTADLGKSPHVQSRKQIVAIALSTQRRARGRAMGGVAPMPGMPMGIPMGSMGMPDGMRGLPMPAGMAPTATHGIGTVAGLPMGPGAPAMNVAPPGAPPIGRPPGMTPAPGMPPGGLPPIGAMPPPMGGMGFGAAMAPLSPMMRPLMADGGIVPHRAMGGPDMMKGPNLSSSWEERSEARNLTRGPVLSASPGRADTHLTKVPSGAYVVPSDVISGRGQGNTLAGMSALQRMFKMGPYGTSLTPMRGGRGTMPRPPRAPHAAGGRGGNGNIGAPTDVALSGGEMVIPPENLMAVVNPDLDAAHQIMDAWVLNERKNHIKTLQRLPGPAKD